MGDHKIPKIPVADPIGDAIVSVDEKAIEADRQAYIALRKKLFPMHFFADMRFGDGRPFEIIVPDDFDADQFESVVGVLMQIRVHADQKRQADAQAKLGGLIVPDHALVGTDGKRLS